jgi:hypothetical protein
MCVPYRGELARHRLITADGYDYIVATLDERPGVGGFHTGAYPVNRGYLVMVRQPLFEVRSDAIAAAREQHEQLVTVLAEAGVGVVRARRSLLARRRAESIEAAAARRGQLATIHSIGSRLALDVTGASASPLAAGDTADLA